MPVKHSVFEHVGKKFTTSKISQRVQQMSVSAIKEMSLLAMEQPDTINLAWGLPSFETPLPIRKKISQELMNNPDIGKYAPPPGLPALKQRIAERLHQAKGIDVDPKINLVITAGGMQALMMTWLTILEAGDEVLLTSPGFSSHYEQITLAGGISVPVPLIEERGWQFDLDGFKNALTPKTKAVVIVNPSNPTGALISEKDLRRLAAFALEHDLFIVTDDPYETYVYDGQRAFHMISIPEIKDRIISCFSFSKEFAMTGWRVGWVVAEEGIINQILKVQDAFVICAPHISQIAALTALEESYDPTRKMIEELAIRRDIICGRLDNLPGLFSYQRPEGAYYIFPKIIPAEFQDSIAFCVQLLNETGVVVVPGSAFGPTGEGHLRMSYCFTREEINQAFDRIDSWWNNYEGDHS